MRISPTPRVLPGYRGGSDDWKKPVGVLSVFTLIGFILGCVSTDMAKNNAKAIYKLETDPVPSECVFGDQLFGETLYEAPQHSHSHYQIVGVGSKSGESASITWAEAFADAKSRCYNGHPGYLAMIGSQAENDFVQGLITAVRREPAPRVFPTGRILFGTIGALAHAAFCVLTTYGTANFHV